MHKLRAPPVRKGIAEGDGERERREANKREREREAKETRKTPERRNK